MPSIHSNGNGTTTSNNSISNLSAETFASLLSGPLIEIVVGSEHKRWHLHLNLLRYHSGFFRDQDRETQEKGTDTHINGVNEDSVEDQSSTKQRIPMSRHVEDDKRTNTGVLDLPSEDPSAFRILVKWLYQGTIQDVSTIPDPGKWDYAYTCQNLYLLAERLSLPDLKNLAIDQFRRGCYQTRLVPGTEEIGPVYERTPPNSPFRQLVCRIVARQIMDPDTKRDASVYRTLFATHPDFAIDVLNAIREGTEGMLLDDPTEGNGCRYHEHLNGESCLKSVHFGEGEKA